MFQITKLSDEILDTQFVNKTRKGYVTVKGFTLPEAYGEYSNEIENFEVYDDDVWVCSFPKSGTTWTQEMVWLIENNFNYEKAKRPIYERFPHFELHVYYDLKSAFSKNPNLKRQPFSTNSFEYIKNLKRPRLIKTHLPFALLPNQIRKFIKKPKIIYITRNCKDVCVSFYHFSRDFDAFTGTFETYSRLFLKGKVPYGPFWHHNLGFWVQRNKPNVLILRYEKLKENLPSVIKDVARFLQKPASESDIRNLVNHLSFENMKNNRSVNYSSLAAFLNEINESNNQGVFMRSGKIGNYKEIMSKEIEQEFDVWIKGNIGNTGFLEYEAD
ncbi:sulfotransferase 1 family member D1-like [Agrilus planipennis]|uniref:Sulfotransferase 1 family member D1-like n=1 Tax=Agrilus planipennis TaxID=224129 RepID=A0A1W4X4Y1_AGRPL|nr:sulfotransferase 1 family member D1-like [Agrilus planipennis]